MTGELLYDRDVFAANLRQLLESSGQRQVYIARLLDVSRATVSAYCRGSQMPRIDKLQRIASHFGVSLRELIEERLSEINVESAPLSALYASLGAESRRELLRYGRELLENQAYRASQAAASGQIRHYCHPAAAGSASPVNGEDFELIDRRPDMPPQADFCITIHGDSMAPYINDGDIVYVRRDAVLEEFDVGIFYVDGDVFCKQWCMDCTGTFHLLSANPLRQSANISIPADGGRSCVCFGKVLLPRRLPPPCYE